MECHAVNKISKTVTDSFINIAYVHYYRNSSIISLMDLYTMDWQLPDIGKTITNTILPSSLSAYTVRIRIQSCCRSAVVGYFRAFTYRVALV